LQSGASGIDGAAVIDDSMQAATICREHT